MNWISNAELAKMQQDVLDLAERWDLSDNQLAILLGLHMRDLRRWRDEETDRPGVDVCARIVHLIAIRDSLFILFSDQRRADGWIRRPNDAFGGQSALDVMMSGETSDLARVHHYLKAQVVS